MFGLLPLVVGLQLVFTIGAVLLVAGLQVRYRDVKYLTEVGLLLGFYLTPIFYPLDLISSGSRILHLVYLLNPMVWIVELYRLALLGGTSGPSVLSPMSALGIAAIASAGLFLAGLLTFRRHEPTFADWVMG